MREYWQPLHAHLEAGCESCEASGSCEVREALRSTEPSWENHEEGYFGVAGEHFRCETVDVWSGRVSRVCAKYIPESIVMSKPRDAWCLLLADPGSVPPRRALTFIHDKYQPHEVNAVVGARWVMGTCEHGELTSLERAPD